MRSSIIVWSTVSGAVLGLFIDAALVGAAVVLSSVMTDAAIAARLHTRWLILAATVVLTAIPLVLSALGYLEGELKAV